MVGGSKLVLVTSPHPGTELVRRITIEERLRGIVPPHDHPPVILLDLDSAESLVYLPQPFDACFPPANHTGGSLVRVGDAVTPALSKSAMRLAMTDDEASSSFHGIVGS